MAGELGHTMFGAEPAAEVPAEPDGREQGDTLDILSQFKEPLLAELRALEAERAEIAERHRRELVELDAKIGQRKRILKAMDPDTFGHPAGRPTKARVAQRVAAAKPQTGMGEEKLSVLRGFIFRHLSQNDTVTQVDARQTLDWDSSDTAVGFRILRDRDQLLRLSGQRGNMKFYKLTEAGREAQAEALAGKEQVGPVNP